MARIQTQAQSTAYGTALTLEASSTQIECSFLDGGALVAGTVKVLDPQDNAVEIPIGADQTYVFNLPRGTSDGWTVQLKAAAATPTGQLLET